MSFNVYMCGREHMENQKLGNGRMELNGRKCHSIRMIKIWDRENGTNKGLSYSNLSYPKLS